MDTYKSSMFPLYLAMLIFLWIGLSDFIRISYLSIDLEALLKVKKRKIPRIPLACIACMYLYLLTAAQRLFLFADSLRYGVQIFSYICMFMVICILSGLNLISIQTLYGIGAASQIKRGWIVLKLAFVPFLPLNTWLFEQTIRCIDPEVIGYALLLLIPLWPFFLLLHLMIPVIFPLILDVANGCIGISYIRYLRQQTGNMRQPSGYHFGVQMIPGLDLVSALFILIKYRKSRLGSKAAETNFVTVQYPCASQCAPPSPYATQISYADRSPYDVQSPYTAQTSYADRSPHASQPPYTALSLWPYRTASAAAPKIYKKLKKHRKSLFLLYLLCGILLYFWSEIAESAGKVYEEITAEETVFYEMTEEEVDLIQSFYWEKEVKDNIAAGQLTGFQAELPENFRNGYS